MTSTNKQNLTIWNMSLSPMLTGSRPWACPRKCHHLLAWKHGPHMVRSQGLALRQALKESPASLAPPRTTTYEKCSVPVTMSGDEKDLVVKNFVKRLVTDPELGKMVLKKKRREYSDGKT